MSFHMIHGQEHAKRMLQNGLKLGKLSHAYIFSGPAGSGRKEMARKLAQAVFCTEKDDDACGGCLECRKVEHGNHPDLHWIQPDGSSVKIEQIRDLQKQFAYRSKTDQKKIYVIEQADKMTVHAANSLLKFLEEPGADVIAILITENGQALLPTIKSRAQWIPFTPRSKEEMTELLCKEGLPSELVRPAVHLAAGLDAARQLIQGNWFAEARNVMLQLARETLTRFPHALLTAQQQVIKTELVERIPVILDLWLLWLKDMIHLRYGRKESVIYIDQAEWMATHAMSRETSYWVSSMEHVLELQKRLRFHANPQLALEKLMIDLQGG